jgi:D-tyrosyl-tRNA(Tyr) deacylase
MRVVIQRVSHASVAVDGDIVGEIGAGLLVLVGIEEADESSDADWLVSKIVNLRLFADPEGVMNRSVLDTGGGILLISQFTLHASTKKGNRPSYIRAARPDTARPAYESFAHGLSAALGKPVARGIFGADMKVTLLNDGPVTIVIDSKNRE